MTAQYLTGSDVAKVSGFRGILLIPAACTLLLPLAHAVLGADAFMSASALSGGRAIWLLGYGATSIGFAIAWAHAAFLMVKRSPAFPPAFILLTIAGVVLGVAELVLPKLLFDVTPTQAGVKEVALSATSAAIWVQYMRVSVRVANTFQRTDGL
jgi:hypothetical protein